MFPMRDHPVSGSVRWRWRSPAALTALLTALLAACATAPEATREPDAEAAPQGRSADAPPWSVVTLPGKRPTRYSHVRRDGRAVIEARAQSSASMYRQRLDVPPEQLGTLEFSWWVPFLIPGADLLDKDRADSPVRVVLAFDGDHRRLSPKNRMMFELAETLTGETPPYATLMYVWDNRQPLESTIPGGRSDRIRKIVVDSGADGLNTWRRHRRDIAADFQRAFGEAPGRLIGVGVMTDSDNTGAVAQALYGAVVFHQPDGRVLKRIND